MVWTCTEERRLTCRQEAWGESSEEIYRCREKGHEVRRRERRRCSGTLQGTDERETISTPHDKPTVVDEADRRRRVKTGRRLSRCDFLEAVGEPVEEVLPLLAEAEPQVELQLGLDRPACGAEALLTRELEEIVIKIFT